MPYIDYTALRVKPSPRKVAAWRESVRQYDEEAGQHGPASYPRKTHASRWVGIVAALAVFFAVIGLLSGLNMLLQQGDTFGILAVVAALLFGAFWVYFQWRVRELAEGWTQPYRLMTFADDNHLHALPVTGPGELPGRIFGRGLEGSRVRHDVVAWTQSGRQCHVTTESWHSGNPSDGSDPDDDGSCRYLAVRIGTDDLPGIDFDAPAEHPEDQLRLSPGAEESAAAIFTDRVISLLTHPAQPRDAEVAGPWFFAYDLTDTDPLEIAGWERTFALIAALPAELEPPLESHPESPKDPESLEDTETPRDPESPGHSEAS